MRWPGALGFAVAVASAGPPPTAPTPPGGPPVPVFPSEADLVQLDVVVTDRDGRPVEGLRREDFALFEDGRSQPVTHFATGTATRPAILPRMERPGSAPAAAEVPDAATDAPASRGIVLVFDDLHIGASALMATKRAAARFLEEQVGPGDRVALVTTSGIRGGAQPLTRDRAAVARAIERVTLQDRSARVRYGRPYISEQQAEQISQFGELATGGNDAFELAVAQFIEEYRIIDRSVAESMVRERVRDVLAEGARYTRASLGTIETTLRSLAAVPGRKIVVLLTEGFYLGRGTFYETAYDVRRIADAATRANVAIYSIDVGGLTVPTPAGDITERTPVDAVRRSRVEWGMDQNRREGLRAVAEETGGFAVLDRNLVGTGLRQVLADNEHYYLLAYSPAASGKPGRFRRIDVRLPGRRDLVVRTRRGYFEVAPATAEEPDSTDPEAALRDRARDALTSIAPLSGIPLRLAAQFVDLPDAGPVVVVNVGLDLGRVGPGHDAAPIDVVLVATDEDGNVADQFSTRVPLGDAVAAAARRADGIRVVQRWLPLKAGRYQLRAAALAPGSPLAGSAFQWVEVPDLAAGRLALSDLFLSPAAEGPRPPAHIPAALWRRFPAGSEIEAAFFAYNAQPDELGHRTLVVRFRLLRDGRLVHEFQPRPMSADAASGSRVPGGARLSLAGLPPGEYELGAVVEDRRAGASTARLTPFTVL